MKKLFGLIVLLLPLTVSGSLIQYPAFTPAGDITFTCQGDIWLLRSGTGNGERITVHNNRETGGLVSPDGASLAYITDRHGDAELYRLSLLDNSEQRLTWTDSRKSICFWHDEQLFFTERKSGRYPRRYRLYSLDNRGKETLVIDDDCGAADISPDGQSIVYTRYRIDWTRKHYRGSKNNDLYLFRRDSGSFQRLTDTPWNEAWANFSADGGSLYFVSDADSVRNLYRFDLASGEQQQLTFFIGDGVLFPRINAARTKLVFTSFNSLYSYELASGQLLELTPRLSTPPSFNTVTREPVDGNAGDYCVSPDQHFLVASVRGDLFLTRRKDKRTVQLTNDNWHNDHPRFSPGGDTLYFLSNRAGLPAVWILTHTDTSLTLAQDYHRKMKQVTDLEERVREFTISPDGGKLALTAGYTDILIHDLKKGRSRHLLSGYEPFRLRWYGDNNWLLYQSSDGEFNQDLFLVETGEDDPVPINISNHPKSDSRAVISPNGFWVAWIHEARNLQQPQVVTLTRRVWELSRPEIEDALREDSTTSALQIDLEGLFDRVETLPHPEGEVRRLLFSPDSKELVYILRADDKDHLYRADWEGKEEKEIASASRISGLRWMEKGNRIYFRTGGKIKYLGAGGGKTETVEFSGEQTVDQLALQEQKFITLWLGMRDRFYDPAMHGVDWQRMYHKYHDLAVSQLLDEDFNTVAEMMVGELNSSHQGVSGGQNDIEGDNASYLGITTVSVRDGRGERVVSIFPGGPADKGNEGLVPDDIILEVDHQPVSSETPLQSLLLGRAWETVNLLVQKDRKQFVLTFTPDPGWRFDRAAYRQWVEQNRQQVDQLSDGRVAYVHVASMNWRNVLHLERELFARASGREVLIIDVRNNGGGYTTDYLLTMLNYQPHAFTVGRDGERGYPQGRIPYYYWHRPVVVMCNENSFSNAEIFAHAIKTLQRGPVVGMPTFGGVISTGGFRLEDGTRVREPFRGWYTADTGMNLENTGCQPDLVIPLEPDQIRQGLDPQLTGAIREAVRLIP